MTQPPENWVTVAARSALIPGNVIGVKVGDLDVAVYNIDGEFYASDNTCPHAYAHLSQGWLDGDVIECPLHAGCFEIKTGKGISPPVTGDRIRIFPVRVSGEDIQINVAL